MVVMKNNEPEAVLLSPEKYVELTDKAEDYDLMMVYERMDKDNGTGRKSFEEVLADNGMSEQDLEGWEDIEIEQLEGRIIPISQQGF